VHQPLDTAYRGNPLAAGGKCREGREQVGAFRRVEFEGPQIASFDEETLAFELVKSLDAAQKTSAVTTEPPKEIRAAGEPQPPQEPAAGIAWRQLTADQRGVLRRLVAAYCSWMTADVAAERIRLIEAAPGGWDDVRFAWAGALEPGVGHAYRVEGPTFLIEFVNVQPDAEGTPANHIHCVWRDRTGDFDLPAKPIGSR
jgi:hypothetical protein